METKPEIKTETPRILRSEHICLSLPVYGKADVPFVQCLMQTLATTAVVGFVDFLPGDSLVNRARNNLAHRFMVGFPGLDDDGKPVVTQFDWMMFIDTDLVFKPEAVELLYELGRERGPGVYVGTYPIKQLKPKVVMNAVPGHKIAEDGTVEVREAGTGLMLIHRDVFAKMQERYRDEIEYETDSGSEQVARTIMHDYFSVGVRKDPNLGWKRFLSEDWYFCQRWREMGGKILMQTRISCGHIGQFTFPGNPQEVIDAAEVFKKGIEKMKERHGAAPVLVKTVRQAEPVAA